MGRAKSPPPRRWWERPKAVAAGFQPADYWSESNMKPVDDSGDLPSRKRYGKARENGLRGSEFHSLTVRVAVLVHRF